MSACPSDLIFSLAAAESISPVYATVGSVTSMNSPDEERIGTDRIGTVGKASHYSGIGPVDESGIPIATRTVSTT